MNQNCIDLKHTFFKKINLKSRVSNRMGRCNFLGQRDRSSINFSGQRDNLKILPQDGTGQESLSKSKTGHGQGQPFKVQDAGRDRSYFDSLFCPDPEQKAGPKQKQFFFDIFVDNHVVVLSRDVPSRPNSPPKYQIVFHKKSPTQHFIKRTLLVPYVRGQTCMTRYTRGGKIGQVLQKSIIIVMWKMLTSKSISLHLTYLKRQALEGVAYVCYYCM